MEWPSARISDLRTSTGERATLGRDLWPSFDKQPRTVRPWLVLLPGFEIKRCGVDAVAQAGGLGAILEDVPEMPATAPAGYLGPDHAVAGVDVKLHVLQVDRLREARPPGPGVELDARIEEHGAAACATVGS